jgi:hypothetical protein
VRGVNCSCTKPLLTDCDIGLFLLLSDEIVFKQTGESPVIRILCLLFTLISFQPTQAQMFAPITKPIGQAEKIIIRGYKGQLQILPGSTENLIIEAKKSGDNNQEGWSYQVQEKGLTIEILVKSSSEKEDWQNLTDKKNIPDFSMKVTAPARALEVFWNQGQFIADGLKSSLNLQMTEGEIKVSNGKGDLFIQTVKGKVQVTNQEGQVDLQSYSGQSVLEKTKGSLKINNFSSTYSISNHKGPLDLRNHSGSVSIKQLEGHTNIRNLSGVISLRNMDGSFEGQFEKGALDAQFIHLQNFVLSSEEATISLDVPKDSGAMVSLRSEKGHMRAPPYIGKASKGMWTERKGRLKGDEQGNIKIISKYGDIVLK